MFCRLHVRFVLLLAWRLKIMFADRKVMRAGVYDVVSVNSVIGVCLGALGMFRGKC